MTHHKPTKCLFLQHLQLDPPKILGNRAFQIYELHFTLCFLWFSGSQNCHIVPEGTTHMYIYIYIYIYAMESQTLVQKWPFLESKLGPSFFFFPFFHFKILLLSAGRMRFSKKNWRRKKTNITLFLSQNLVQLCCVTYLDQVLTQPWDQVLTRPFWHVWPFFIFQNMLKPLFL